MSALLWDFLFIPPLYTFYIAKFEDGFMLFLFFVVALVTGQLTSRLRLDERNERQRERRATSLYRLTRSIGTATTLDDVIAQASLQIKETFEADSGFYVATSTFGLPATPHPAGTLHLDEKEHGVAVWAYRNRRTAGRSTDTLTSSLYLHAPLLTATRAYGVMVIKPAAERTLTLEERDLLESFAQQIALVLEKESLRSEAESARLLSRSDELHRALFHSVSHELQTPLAILQSGLDELVRTSNPQTGRVIDAMSESVERLKRLVKNLLDSARLETGRLELRREWGEVSDLIEQAIELAGQPLLSAQVVIKLPQKLPLLHIDFVLIAQALANILHNAVVHGAAPAKIEIAAEVSEPFLSLQIRDNGPGIPSGLLQGIFDRFVRAPGAKPGGTGLGLPIAKGFVEAHGGSLEARNLPERGSLFIIRLPLEKAPESLTLQA